MDKWGEQGWERQVLTEPGLPSSASDPPASHPGPSLSEGTGLHGLPASLSLDAWGWVVIGSDHGKHQIGSRESQAEH